MTHPDLTESSRRAWAALETLHVVGYFAEEPRAAYVALGLHPRLSYFAARGAAFGAVSPAVTEATFYVFAPWLHRKAIPAAWEVTTPERVIEARREGVSLALQRILGTPDIASVLAIARRVCDGLAAAGRPLYAAHAALAWPEDDLMALWHAATLVREHRGDGHVAVLTSEGVDPVEATVLDGVWSARTGFLTTTRGWTEEEYAAAAERLTDRGWLGAEGGLTDAGREERQRLESRTDQAAMAGWQRVGLSDTDRLAELMQPVRRAVLTSGVLPDEIRAALSRAAGD